jgi:transposase
MQYTAQHKHSILTHYRAGERGAGFAALARRFAVQGGAGVIQRWHERWDGTARSLETRKRSGRPRALSSEEVQQHVRAPILRANREHCAVHYPKLHAALVDKTGKQVSIQTVRRIGHEKLGARQRRGKKRTADESEYLHT